MNDFFWKILRTNQERFLASRSLFSNDDFLWFIDYIFLELWSKNSRKICSKLNSHQNHFEVFEKLKKRLEEKSWVRTLILSSFLSFWVREKFEEEKVRDWIQLLSWMYQELKNSLLILVTVNCNQDERVK